MSTDSNRTGQHRHASATIVAVVVAVVALLASVTTMIVVLSGDEQRPVGSAPPTSGAPSTGSSTVDSSTTLRSSSAPATTTSARSPAPPGFGYQPLWPFTYLTQVRRWQYDYRSGGHAPWHLDPAATAIAFTTGYLSLREIDVVVWLSVRGREALVAVGFPVEGQKPATAAVLHLARFGDGGDAPWEVVGSKDTNLTLTRPAYGAVVRSPFSAGGRITGVDEDIRVQVRQPSSATPIGQTPVGVAAGGEAAPWSTLVSFRGATDPALTMIALTGGHITDVELFAITGVQAAR